MTVSGVMHNMHTEYFRKLRVASIHALSPDPHPGFSRPPVLNPKRSKPKAALLS